MLAVAVLCLAELVNVLGVTVAVPALPAIERDLDTSGELVVTGYAAAFGGLLILAGRPARRSFRATAGPADRPDGVRARLRGGRAGAVG